MKDVDAEEKFVLLLNLLYACTHYSFGKKFRLVYATAALILLNQIEDTLPCMSIF